MSLRDVMRNAGSAAALNDQETNEQLVDVIAMAVGNKKAKHAGMDLLAGMQNRSMVMIGG